jgi:hypothetical protein
METQHQIKRTLSEPLALEFVAGLLDGDGFAHRSELAGFLCEHFGFYDGRGRRQRDGCVKALRELEAAGHFRLPAPRSKNGPRTPLRLTEAVPEPTGAPGKVGEVGDLELIRVGDTDHMRIWNELMIREHPRGHGPLVGRQLRYLVGSRHGWLGGFGFAAAALQLADRDRWIGWDVRGRRHHLHGVVNLSRFLIRPGVRCANLASRLLALVVERLPEDFERQYGYRPLLVETFVDREQASGTCFRAANWMCVGRTRGRGRQDRLLEAKETAKDIYVYPLEKDFRARWGLAPHAGGGPLGPTDGLESETWAQQEFGGAPLGDARLSQRLVKVAGDKADQPWRAYCGVARGDWPAVKAYYRLIDAPDGSAVTMDHLLLPHRERTVRRMRAQRTVLCVQDGSDLNYTALAHCTGLGELSTNQTGAKSRGLHLHSTLALTSTGLPLGVLRAQCLAPEPRSPGDDRPSCAIPIEEKKTFAWIEHHRDLVDLAAGMPHTRLIEVCDREADFFEMFDEQRRRPGVELLVRAQHNRTLAQEPYKLFEAVRQEPVQQRVRVDLGRQSARPKRSKQQARPGRPGRTAELAVRSLRIRLRPPAHLADREPLDLRIVHAVEENPPGEAAGVEWFLLTTLEIATPEDAVQCLRWYCLRWRIEDWHRVLKTGCRVEVMAHDTADRLRRALAINLVIAWRIMLMTLLGREVPDLPAECLFSDIEIKTLQAYAQKRGLPPPTLIGEAIRLIAKIGGYLGRNNDPPPGHQLMWQGYAEFQYMCLGFQLRDE